MSTPSSFWRSSQKLFSKNVLELQTIRTTSRNVKNGKILLNNYQRHAGLVMANLGQVLKKQVSGFDFKKPGYLGRVLDFQNCTNLANLDWKIDTFCQITKLVLFISPKYGNFKLFSEFLNILPQSEIFLIHQFDKPHAQYI